MPRRSSGFNVQERRRVGGIAAALVIVTVLTYARSLDNGFVNFDDREYVGNPFVRMGLTWASVRWALTTLELSNWHPLTWLSLQLDHELFGLHPAASHGVSLVLHAINSAALFWALAQMTGAVGRSACVAAIFALHPLHVESVAWAAERKDVLSGFFWIATLGLYERYCRRPGWMAYTAVFMSFALGLMAKPMVVTLPFALLLLDYWPLERWKAADVSSAGALGSRLGRLAAEKLPLLALSGASCVLTFLAQKWGGSVRSGEDYALSRRLLSVPLNYVDYLRRTFWPANLAIMYPYPLQAPPLWQPLAAIALLAVITALAVGFGRRFPYAPVGWFWFLGTLTPVIGLVQAGVQATADRYTYLPMIGLSIAVCWGWRDLSVWLRWSPRFAAAVAGLLLAGCDAASWLQIGYWHDSVRLWRHALAVEPRSAPTCKLLGSALLEIGGRDEAETLFERSLRLDPNDEEARMQLAVLLSQAGRLDEATKHFEIVLRRNQRSPVAHHDVGRLAELQGRLDAAIGHYREAIRLDPQYAAAHERLGRALIARGDVAAGRRQLSEAARLNSPRPNRAPASGERQAR